MRVMKLVLLMLIFSASAGAADKPARTVKTKILGFPEYKSYSRLSPATYRPEYRMQITANDEIMLSYFHLNTPQPPTDKSTRETSGVSFVVLLLSKEDGKLINKKEWPIAGEPSFEQRRKYTIFPLPDGGYVALFNGRLQVLDAAFSIIHDRLLDRLPQRYVYGISVPLQGSFFVLDSGVEYEIIDYNTFKTVKRLSASIPIRDIWEDKLLLRSEDAHVAYNLYERKIGDSSSDYNVKIDTPLLRGEKFIHNGNAIILSSMGLYTEERQDYWLTIESGKAGNPVLTGGKRRFNGRGEGISGVTTARRVPVAVIYAHKNRGWDLGDYRWLEAYDTNTGQKLLETKTYNDGTNAVLSSDGRTLAVFIEEKVNLEFYNIPAPGSKKK